MSDAGHLGDRLIERLRALGHPLCVGLDPHLDRIPPLFAPAGLDPAAPETAQAVEDFVCAVVDRLGGRVGVVKPQIAFFEQLGWPGIRALKTVLDRCREAGLIVLLDAKRSDMPSSAEGYARAYLAPDAPLASDALTVNPYLGLETLEPYLREGSQRGGGIFVLVKTSNAGSGDLQDREVDGTPLYQVLGRELSRLGEGYRGTRTGWSSLGAVVGATYPDQGEALRELMPHTPFLVPGYGAQGAGAADAVRTFVPGPAGLEGGLVSSSRAITFPDGGHTDDARSWERAIDAAIDAAIDELGAAVSR